MAPDWVPRGLPVGHAVRQGMAARDVPMHQLASCLPEGHGRGENEAGAPAVLRANPLVPAVPAGARGQGGHGRQQLTGQPSRRFLAGPLAARRLCCSQQLPSSAQLLAVGILNSMIGPPFCDHHLPTPHPHPRTRSRARGTPNCTRRPNGQSHTHPPTHTHPHPSARARAPTHPPTNLACLPSAPFLRRSP